MAHYQPTMKHEEILFQIPVRTTNISIMQSSDQVVNYAPVVHTIPTQTDSYIYDVESVAPMLITLTPIQSPTETAQLTANDSQASADSGVEISPNGSFFNEVSANLLPNASQITVSTSLDRERRYKDKNTNYFRHFC